MLPRTIVREHDSRSMNLAADHRILCLVWRSLVDAMVGLAALRAIATLVQLLQLVVWDGLYARLRCSLQERVRHDCVVDVRRVRLVLLLLALQGFYPRSGWLGKGVYLSREYRHELSA